MMIGVSQQTDARIDYSVSWPRLCAFVSGNSGCRLIIRKGNSGQGRDGAATTTIGNCQRQNERNEKEVVPVGKDWI